MIFTGRVQGVGFRYYANVEIQHYKPSLFESKTQPIGFIDYTLNADLLVNFWESEFVSLGMLGGIGFTMALFVGKLSLPVSMQEEIRLGILCGSALSALWGALVFQFEDRLKAKKPLLKN